MALGIWYSIQSLPSWADNKRNHEILTAEGLSQKINREGIATFLGNKTNDVLKGKVILDDIEFSAILLASLKDDKRDQKLLSASDAIRAFIKDDHVKITAIINLDKLEKVQPKARKNKLTIKDDFHIRLGAIPISNEALQALGAKIERINSTQMSVKYLSIKSIQLTEGQITLGVLPRL